MKKLVLFSLMIPAAFFADAKDDAVPALIKENAAQYKALRKRLDISDTDLSRTDVLELIALSYAGMMDGINAKVADLERRVRTLEDKTRDLRTDTDKLKDKSEEMQRQIAAMDGDINKIFDCYNKLQDEVRNELCIDGIASKFKELKDNVSNDLDAHARTINSIQRGVNQNASDIQSLDRAIRNLRFR